MEEKILNSWITEIERLRAENKELTVCRDHWKISYETRNAENKALLEACKKWQTANVLGDAQLLADARITRDLAIAACQMVLDYLPAKDGKSFAGDPDSQVQLIICNKLKAAIAKPEGN